MCAQKVFYVVREVPYRVENWEELFVASKAPEVKEKNLFQTWTEDLNDMNLMISCFKI